MQEARIAGRWKLEKSAPERNESPLRLRVVLQFINPRFAKCAVCSKYILSPISLIISIWAYYKRIIGDCAFPRRKGARIRLSYWFIYGNFSRGAKRGARARAAIDNKKVRDIVNSQTLITTRHALLLAISSCFARPLLVRFRFFSLFSRKFRVFGAALTCQNSPRSAVFLNIVQVFWPPSRVARKSPLVEGACSAFSGAVADGKSAGLPHRPYGATTENRAVGVCGGTHPNPVDGFRFRHREARKRRGDPGVIRDPGLLPASRSLPRPQSRGSPSQ